MDKSSSFGRWRRTSPDGRSIDDVGASSVEIQRRYEHDVRECCRQFAACLGFTDGSVYGLRGTLEEYLVNTGNKGWPEGYSAFLEGLESGTIRSVLDICAEEERGWGHIGAERGDRVGFAWPTLNPTRHQETAFARAINEASDGEIVKVAEDL